MMSHNTDQLLTLRIVVNYQLCLIFHKLNKIYHVRLSQLPSSYTWHTIDHFSLVLTGSLVSNMHMTSGKST